MPGLKDGIHSGVSTTDNGTDWLVKFDGVTKFSIDKTTGDVNSAGGFDADQTL